MRNKAALVGVVAVVAALWFARSGGDDEAAQDVRASDDAELVNRFWISKVPQTAKEKIDVFVMLDEPHFGLFETTSAFEGDYTFFEWRRNDKGRIEIRMLQTDKGHKLAPNVSRSGCGAFDLCMTVKGAPRGAKKYFSMDDWIIEPGSAGTVDELRAAARAELARALAQTP